MIVGQDKLLVVNNKQKTIAGLELLRKASSWDQVCAVVASGCVLARTGSSSAGLKAQISGLLLIADLDAQHTEDVEQMQTDEVDIRTFILP